MILNEYAILPFEIGREHMEQTRHLIEQQGWASSSTPGTHEHKAYRITDSVRLETGNIYRLDLVLVGLSGCFLLHRSEQVCGESNTEYEHEISLVKRILKDRQRLHEQLLKEEGSPLFNARLKPLDVASWLQPNPSYMFSFYVFKIQGKLTLDTKVALRILADLIPIGIEADTEQSEGDILAAYFKSKDADGTRDLSDIDPNPYTAVYATYSTIVAGIWGEACADDITEAMLVSMQLDLQAAWNQCRQMDERVAEAIEDKERDLDREDILIDIVRFLQKGKPSLSPKTSKRWRDVHDQLMETSRIEEEFRSLQGSLPLLERSIERNRELRKRKRDDARQRGQGWITFILVILAAISATRVISTPSQLEGWQPLWEPLIWIPLGTIAYVLTVRRA